MRRPTNRGGRQFISDTTLPEHYLSHCPTVASTQTVCMVYMVFTLLLATCSELSQAPVWPNRQWHKYDVMIADVAEDFTKFDTLSPKGL